jgi:hypothetical protein
MPSLPRRRGPLTDAQRDALAPHVRVAFARAAKACRACGGASSGLYDAIYDAAIDAAIRAARRHDPDGDMSLPALVGYYAAIEVRGVVNRWQERPSLAVADEPGPDTTIAVDEAEERAAACRRLDVLGRRGRYVIARTLGLDGPPITLTQAGRELGLTLSGANNLKSRAYSELRLHSRIA